jgi:hypothetical protein
VQLVRLLLGGPVSAGLLWAAFPYAVAAAATVVFVLIAGYASYQLVDERTLRRRAWIDGKRVEQDTLKRELLLADATLVLVGEPQDRQRRFTLRGPGAGEFGSALRYREAQSATARVGQHPQAGKASRRSQLPAAPARPDVAAVRRRRDVLEAELDRLEAEIQALSTPQAIDLAGAAEEAERSYDQRRDAAHEASASRATATAAARRRAPPHPSTGSSCASSRMASAMSATWDFRPRQSRSPAASSPQTTRKGDDRRTSTPNAAVIAGELLGRPTRSPLTAPRHAARAHPRGR